MKVLVVDDSRSVRNLAKMMLEQGGHQVVVAEDGKAGIEMLKTNQDVEVVFLDWNMPVLDGPGFLEQKASEAISEAPVIMLTTENKPQFIAKALELGAKEYVMKPFTPEILASKIEMVKKGF